MRTSIRLRLLILMLVPAFTLLALSGLHLASSFELSRQTGQFNSLLEVTEAQYGLVDGLRSERTQTLQALLADDAAADGADDPALTGARQTTDQRFAELQALVGPALLTSMAPEMAPAHQASVSAVEQVQAVRAEIDAGALSASDVQLAYQEPIEALQQLEAEVTASSLEEVAALSAASTRRTALVGGAALVALLFTIVLLFALTRGIVHPLRKLTDVAGKIAESMPARVAAVARGEDLGEELADATLGPDLLERADELGNLARALGAATDQATQVALEQARTRHGVAQTISDVARREQRLVERQLSLLEVMESREEDPEQLSQLFALDHMATRMRRNAENLLLLSIGQMPGTGETEPLALVDVVRSAAAETEDYARVDVRVGLPLDVVGYAATPLAHLLAELIENATTFSPPNTRVSVTTQRQSAGVTVAIVDRGLGMAPHDLEDARQRLLAPPLLEAAESRRLGLYVVGLLAQRMGVTVDLQPCEGGGLEVHVWLPETLFTRPPEATSGPAALAASVAAAPPAGPAPTAAPPVDIPPVTHAEPAAPPPQADYTQPGLEEATPDAFSVMQHLLDATPSAPPPLPDDVAAPSGPLLPTRDHEAAEAPPPEQAGLSLARASGGSTVDLDPTQVSQLMRSFSDDLNFGLADPEPQPIPPPSSTPPTVAPPTPSPVAAERPPAPATPAPAPRPTPTATTSSWSTPFPTKGGPR